MHTESSRVAAIIEDDADIRHLIEVVLRRGGFRTVSALNGVDGVEIVREHKPVVTILDVAMPGIDGFETARLIRKFSTTALIFLTARDRASDVQAAWGAGADAYMVKPFRARKLRAQVEEVIHRPVARLEP